MSDPFVGEIRMFAGGFAPRGWALCDGQLLAVNQNDALFSLFGTIYGGDGRSTFGLPDFRGRVPMHVSAAHRLGQKTGTEQEQITPQQMPAHTHGLRGSTRVASGREPAGQVLAEAEVDLYGAGQDTLFDLSSAGGGAPHTNLMPFVCVQFIVALFGVYPARN